MNGILNSACVRFTALLVALGGGGRAAAQPMPDPQPVLPEQDPEPDIAKWVRAYERDGRPTILVLCGVSDGLIEASGSGKVLWNYDIGGVPSQIAGALEEIINPPDGDVELVDLNALHDAKERLGGILDLRSEHEAVSLIARDLSADRIITITLSPSIGGGPKVLFTCSDQTRARKIFDKAFDWRGDFSALNIKRNMRVVAARFIDTLDQRTHNARRSFTLRILGLASDAGTLIATKEAISAVSGVTDAKKKGQSTTLGESATEYEVRYESSTDADDLLLLIQQALESRFSTASVSVVKQEGGTLCLRVTSKVQPERAQELACLQLINSDNPEGVDARARLRELWQKKNSPKIMVMVNRRPTEEEVRQAQGTAGPAQVGTLVVVSGSGDASALNQERRPTPVPNSKTQDEFRQPNESERIARQLETEVGRLFGPDLVNLTTVQSDVARAKLMERAQKQQGIMQQEDLSKMLVSLGVADIYVIGYASGIKGVEQCTFNATTSDGIIIGVSTFDGPSQEARVVARRVFGELSCGMMRSWRPPAQITVHLLGIADMAEYDSIRKAINDLGGTDIHTVGTDKFDKSSGEGIVEFYLEYSVPSSELVERLMSIKDRAGVSLPQFSAESKTDELLQFRVRPAVVTPAEQKTGE